MTIPNQVAKTVSIGNVMTLWGYSILEYFGSYSDTLLAYNNHLIVPNQLFIFVAFFKDFQWVAALTRNAAEQTSKSVMCNQYFCEEQLPVVAKQLHAVLFPFQSGQESEKR